MICPTVPPAEVLQLRHHSAVELVDRAVKAGLVERATDPDDHRRQHVNVTTTGHDLLESLSNEHRRELRGFRSELSSVLDELD